MQDEDKSKEQLITELHELRKRVAESEQYKADPNRAEIAAMQERDFTQAVLDSLPGLFYFLDQQGQFLRWNREFERVSGYSADEICRMSFLDFFNEPDKWIIAERIDKVFQTGEAFAEGELVSKDQTKIPFYFTGKLFRLEEKPCLIGMGIDITERKRAEDALRISLRFLGILHQHTEIAPLLREYVSEIKNYTGCDAVGIRVLDENLNIPYVAYQGFSQKFYETESPLFLKTDECMCISVIRGDVDPSLPFFTEGGAFWVNATSRFLATVSEEEKGRTRNRCNQEGYETVGLFPFHGGGKIFGLVHVADHRENMLPPNVLEVLEKAALQLGTAFQRAQAEEALRESQQMLQSVMDTIPARVFWKDLDLNYLGCNRSFALDGGLQSPEELIGRNDFEMCWGEQADLYRSDDRLVMETGIAKLGYEEPQTMPDGGRIWLRTSKVPLFDVKGEIKGVLGTYEDITVHKRAEEALQKAHDELELRVKERTAALERANEELHQIPSKLIAVQEEERKRLASELHDSIGQTLAAVKFWVEMALKLRDAGDGNTVLNHLEQFIPILQRSIEETRSIYMGLRPSMLDSVGLLATLEWLRQECMKLYPERHIELEVGIAEEEIPENLRVNIFRIAQEALNNIAKEV
ncbi:MAG: PAS domain S-box protein [Syntrophobacteraceae bacterium]